jgi:hypothetical protein
MIVISTGTLRSSVVDQTQTMVAPGLVWTMVALEATTVDPLLVQTTVDPQVNDPEVAPDGVAVSENQEDMAAKEEKVAGVDTADLRRAVAATTRAEAAKDIGAAAGKMSVTNVVDMAIP